VVKHDRPQPLRKPEAALESRGIAPTVATTDVSPDSGAAATAKTETFSPQENTVVPPAEATATQPLERIHHARSRDLNGRITDVRPASLWRKNISKVITAAILLALILYMVWRITHRTQDAALVEIYANPERHIALSQGYWSADVTPHPIVKNSFASSMAFKRAVTRDQPGRPERVDINFWHR
jgi:hypothetical protein